MLPPLTTFNEIDNFFQKDFKPSDPKYPFEFKLCDIVKGYATNESEQPKKYAKVKLSSSEKAAQFGWKVLNVFTLGIAQKSLNRSLGNALIQGKVPEAEKAIKRGAKLSEALRDRYLRDDNTFEFVFAQLQSPEEHDHIIERLLQYKYHYSQQEQSHSEALLDLYLRYHPCLNFSDSRNTLKSKICERIDGLRDTLGARDASQRTLEIFFKRGFEFGKLNESTNFSMHLSSVTRESLTFLMNHGLKLDSLVHIDGEIPVPIHTIVPPAAYADLNPQFDPNPRFVDTKKYEKVKFTTTQKIRLLGWKIFNFLTRGTNRQTRNLESAINNGNIELATKYIRRGGKFNFDISGIRSREGFAFVCAQVSKEELIKDLSNTELIYESRIRKFKDRLEIALKLWPVKSVKDDPSLKLILKIILEVTPKPWEGADGLRKVRVANETLQIFVRNGIKIEMQDLSDSINHLNAENLSILCQAGVNINAPIIISGVKSSLLLEKIRAHSEHENNTEIINFIISNLDKANRKSHESNYTNHPNMITPLHLAIQKNLPEVIEKLIAKGYDPELCTCNIGRDRLSAKQYAAQLNLQLPVNPPTVAD